MSSSYLNTFMIAGGSGTRIKYLFPNIDKFLIPVSDIPFYVYIINGLNNLNFNYDSIILNISNRFIKSQIFNNQSVEFLHDKCLKDTAGGFLTGLESLLPINLATNCDSLANVFKKKFFFKNILLNLKIISLTSVKKITSYEKCNFRYGYVFKNDCFVLNLFEKVNLSEYSIFNSGLYVINVKLVKDFFFKNIIFFGNKFWKKNKMFSFEKELLATLLFNNIKVDCNEQDDFFVDIGLPEDFKFFKYKYIWA